MINEFEIDDPTSTYPFSQRLQLENKWTYEFTLKQIEEYKRFMYLACVTKKPICPSTIID